MDKELFEALKAYGVNANAAKSKTAEAVADIFLASDAQRVKLINARLSDLESVLESDGEKIQKILDSFEKLAEVSGELQSTDAKDALLLWREMLRVAVKDYRVDPTAAASNISYIMYALYGGEAKKVQL